MSTGVSKSHSSHLTESNDENSYKETIDILYSKNTICIHAQPLVFSIPAVIPHRSFSAIRSLEIALELQGHSEILDGYNTNTRLGKYQIEEILRHLSVNFVNLQKLYLSIQISRDASIAGRDHMEEIAGLADQFLERNPNVLFFALAVPESMYSHPWDLVEWTVARTDDQGRSTRQREPIWHSINGTEPPHPAARRESVTSSGGYWIFPSNDYQPRGLRNHWLHNLPHDARLRFLRHEAATSDLSSAD